MALGTTLSVIANHFAFTTELPTSHGSTRTLNAPLAESKSSDVGSCCGEKISRKELSPFRCRTVTDMVAAARCYLYLACCCNCNAMRSRRDGLVRQPPCLLERWHSSTWFASRATFQGVYIIEAGGTKPDLTIPFLHEGLAMQQRWRRQRSRRRIKQSKVGAADSSPQKQPLLAKKKLQAKSFHGCHEVGAT